MICHNNTKLLRYRIHTGLSHIVGIYQGAEIEAELTTTSLAELNPVAPANDQDDWEACFGNLRQSSATTTQPNESGIETEIKDYLAETTIPRDHSPFTYWGGNQTRYPILCTLALRYLSTPLGSVASERCFKVAKLIVKDRVRLKAENVEMLLFNKYNLRMLRYNLN